MKNIAILFLSLILLAGCEKKTSTSPSPTPTPTPTPTSHPYYFKFTINGIAYNLNSNNPQYMPFYANEIGGYQTTDGALYPSAGIRLSWPLSDTVKESDVLALKGKTLYFSDTLIHPELSFDKTASSNNFLSIDTANTTYNIKISNVVFLKKDTSAGNPLKTYVITGTCSGVLDDGTTTSTFTGGDFNFIISMRDL